LAAKNNYKFTIELVEGPSKWGVGIYHLALDQCGGGVIATKHSVNST